MQTGIFSAIFLLFFLASVSSSVEPKRNGLILKALPDAKIEIRKEARRLELYSGKHLVRRFRIGLGLSPTGLKTREGDGATPEGEYRVCVKNPNSRFYLSLGLSYPNKEDANRALEKALITRAQYDQIVSAEKRGICPPWNTPLGGEIFIHGNGAESDWTLGCIALDDPDMKELYAAARIGTPVIIHP